MAAAGGGHTRHGGASPSREKNPPLRIYGSHHTENHLENPRQQTDSREKLVDVCAWNESRYIYLYPRSLRAKTPRILTLVTQLTHSRHAPKAVDDVEPCVCVCVCAPDAVIGQPKIYYETRSKMPEELKAFRDTIIKACEAAPAVSYHLDFTLMHVMQHAQPHAYRCMYTFPGVACCVQTASQAKAMHGGAGERQFFVGGIISIPKR